MPELMQRLGFSQRNALLAVKMSASSYLYKPIKKDKSALKRRTKEITQIRVYYGYRRVHVLVHREDHKDNVSRPPPLLRGEWVVAATEAPPTNKAVQATGQSHQRNLWHGFVVDAVFDGRKLPMLTVVDLYTRECLAIDVRQTSKGRGCRASAQRDLQSTRYALMDQD